jgi:DNA-binding transcriptional regulator YiaG
MDRLARRGGCRKRHATDKSNSATAVTHVHRSHVHGPLADSALGRVGGVIRIPTEPKTVGDHIQRRRFGLKMLQREVAEQIGVCEPSVFNWEKNASEPEIRYMPAVIRFLGYNPLPAVTTLAAQLVRHRTTLGVSQKDAAREIGVDQGTLARWERGEREPAGAFLERLNGFLADDRGRRIRARRAG